MRFGDLGPTELLLIVVALVLVFGTSKLGEVGGALGRSVREFKKASREEERPSEPVGLANTKPPEQP